MVKRLLQNLAASTLADLVDTVIGLSIHPVIIENCSFAKMSNVIAVYVFYVKYFKYYIKYFHVK